MSDDKPLSEEMIALVRDNLQSLIQQSEGSPKVEHSFEAKKINVGLSDNPGDDHWIPTYVFEVNDAEANTVAILAPEYETNLRLLQQIMGIFLDEEGTDAMRETFVAQVSRMQEQNAYPLLIAAANEAVMGDGPLDPDLVVRQVRNPE